VCVSKYVNINSNTNTALISIRYMVLPAHHKLLDHPSNLSEHMHTYFASLHSIYIAFFEKNELCFFQLTDDFKLFQMDISKSLHSIPFITARRF